MSAIPFQRVSLSRKGAASICVLVLVAVALVSSQILRSSPGGIPGAGRILSKADTLASLPVAFESNGGQADPSTQYIAHNGSQTFLFAPTGVTLLLQSSTGTANPKDRQPPTTTQVGMEFVGANAGATLDVEDTLPGTVNYMVGNDPARWRTGLPTFGNLTYTNLYPGIDLKYEGAFGQLKGTYVVAPGADPVAIRWRYSGAGMPTIDNGNLIIPIANSESLSELAPVAWQEIDGRKVVVSMGYVVSTDGTLRFQVGTYDHARPLVIDPTLAYSTFLGGTGSDDGIGIAVDGQGNTYVTGPTDSPDFPLRNPLQPSNRGYNDVFVTKINATGTGIVYSTYLGGAQTELSWGIAVDSEGSVYLAGWTTSDDFPVINAFQSTRAGGEDVFVSKINPAGTGLVYSTYLGGTGNDEAWHIAQSGGFAYVTGKTGSTDFPTASPVQATNHGIQDIFVTKFSASGLSLAYSTYLGGSYDEESLGVSIDGQGNAYVSGGSWSADYPVAHAYQPHNRGHEDVVISKLNPLGNGLIYSTYLGGSQDEAPWGVAVTQEGDAFVAGLTASPDFPLRRAMQSTKSGGADGFVTRLSPSGSWVVYSTFLGGNGDFDAPYGIAVDEAGNAYVASLSDSADFPLVNPIQATYGGDVDATVSMFGPLGILLFSTYLGGDSEDFAWRIDVDGQGNIYTTGLTRSSNFPTAHAIQPTMASAPDAFVVKITGLPGPTPSPVACRTDFTDVPPGSTFYPYVHCLVCEGLASGYEDNTYRPNDLTSRGQLAKIVSNAAGFSDPMSIQSFEDVPGNSSFYPFIERLLQHDLVSGYPCGGPDEPCVAPGNLPYFRPGANVTRAQAAKIVVGTASFPTAPPEERKFEDVPTDHSFYPWIETMGWLDLVNGYPCGGPGEPCVPPANLPYFRPGSSITRGQAAKLVASSFLKECLQAQGISDQKAEISSSPFDK